MPTRKAPVKRKVATKRKTKIKRGKGQPAHEPTKATRKLVFDLAGYGFDQDTICKWVGITSPTLRKHYRAELDMAQAQKAFLVIDNAFQKAKSRDYRHNNMTMFWLKTREGWREKDPEDEVQALKTAMEILKPMSVEEWEKRYPVKQSEHELSK